ncbi:amidohydrolase family protein [Caulobacter sp. LjRoot300]|uniref:amidohydrolase family protein n=1 Tax=Caulobacter sp. LjRoot300 TaxID=3342321 RepID=UPI003ECD1492
MIDAHLHLWDPVLLDYGWLQHVPSIAGPRGPRDWAAQRTGVRQAVFVQADCAPGQALDEIDWVAGLAHPDLEILGIVAFAPLELGEAVAPHLGALRQRPKVRGVRRSVQNETDAFIADRRHLDGLIAAARQGLTIDLCARDRQLPLLVDLLGRLFERQPDARVALDHLGKPDIAAHAGDIDGAGWADSLRVLAGFPNLSAKISGLTTQDHWSGGRDETLRPYIDHALACFGPERLMFGGDWPVVDLAGGYARWRAVFEAATAALSPCDRLRIDSETASAFYALAPERPQETLP